ncbi:MAG: hypothetical protein NC324_03895 [Bacteroides sp.]|nr:hypothetical protein [Bacteroides sp.]
MENNQNPEHDLVMEAMAQYLDDSKPQLGIFWFDPEKGELLFPQGCDYDSIKAEGLVTFGKLHQTFWKKEAYKARAKGEKNSLFYQDYTMIPRGRVFYDTRTRCFSVKVGSWYKPHEAVLRALLAVEFNLPEDFAFDVDIHWELGNGWDEFDV